MTAPLEVRITVRGRVSARLVSSFAEMRVVRTNGRTTLLGEVVDQAQLHALLTRFRDLGLELECLSVSSADEPGAPFESERRPRKGRR
jgi:hypothetical protein